MEAAAAPVPIRVEPNGSSTGAVVATPAPVASTTQPLRVAEPFELPPEQRLSGAVVATLAAIAGLGAIALGMWAFVSSVRSDGSGEVVRALPISGAAQAISLLSKPATKRIPLEGSGGRIILGVGAGGRGVLVLDGLGVAPVGMTYQAWVINPKSPAVSGAVFAGIETIVPVTERIERGSILGVTVEQAGGARAPTRTLRLIARRGA